MQVRSELNAFIDEQRVFCGFIDTEQRPSRASDGLFACQERCRDDMHTKGSHMQFPIQFFVAGLIW